MIEPSPWQAISDDRAVLGESPVWSVAEQALYWVDSRAPAILRYDWATKAVERMPLPAIVGSIGLMNEGRLIAALQHGFHVVDFPRRGLRALADPERHLPENRFNDGRVDRAGRFWSGTMSDRVREPTGTLYSIDSNARVSAHCADLIVPNSICWSLDDRTMYLADTYRHVIRAFDFDLAGGGLSNERVFVDTTGRTGRPDGSTVDAEDHVWNAEYAGGRLVRYRPDGSIERAVAVPVTQPTSCAFGGPNLDILFVTSARQRMTAEALAAEPLAGAVLALAMDVRGVPEPCFAYDDELTERTA